MVTETTEETRNVASPGVANSALGIGIGALALSVLQNGGLNGFLNGNRPPAPPPEPLATQRDLTYERELTQKDAKIGKLEAQLYTDQQITELRKELTASVAAQAVFNERQSGVIGILQTQVATLNSMTAPYIRQPVMAASEAALSFNPLATAAGKTTTTQPAGQQG